MATESSSRSNFSADSYIGSLISLISKSEIRYEGVLFTINASESSIGLRNVRSFGTEGRKRDGPQFPPSDKVYEYILFRGSDIKDLQVKSSPPVEATAPIYKDPAIIESHYSQEEGPTNLTPSDNGSQQDFTSQTPQLGLPNSTFQGNAPLHQPSQSSGLWGSPQPPPISNGSSFPMPFYLHGFYGASNGLQTPHQSLFQQAPGLSMPLPIHQTVQHPVISAPLPSLTSNLPALPLSVSPPSLMPPFNVGNLSSDLMLPPQTSALVTDSSTISMPNKSPTQVHPAVSSSSLPLITQLNNVSLNKSPFSTPTPEKIEKVAGSVSYSSGFQPEPFPTETSGSFPNNGPRPLLITPNQLLQRGPSPTQLLQPGPIPNQKMLSAPTNQNLQPGCTSNQLSQSGPAPNQCLQPVQFSQPGSTSNQNLPPCPLLQPGPTPSQVLQSGLTTNQVMQPGVAASLSNFCSESAQKDVEMVQVSSLEPSVSKLRDGQPPLLPLPSSFDRKGTRYATRFTEDFDFIAMNEKFNKDEIWGHLGKINTTEEEDHDFQEEDDRVRSSFETKPVYVKDDFFDSLSCNVSDRESCNGRINFSEQRKLDVETFGNFPRYRGGRGYGHGTRGYAGGGRGYAGGGRGGYAGGGYGRRNSGHNGKVWGHHAI